MQGRKQHFWYMVYSIFFLLFAFLLLWSLNEELGSLPTDIPIFDLVIIVLATFRLTRLFVYDKITFFIRDMLQHGEEIYTQEGVTYVRKVERANGMLRTAYELVTCPWCFSIWAALLVTYAYFVRVELFWFPILIFAISGVAGAVQIIVNMFGWIAENKKLEAGEKAKV